MFNLVVIGCLMMGTDSNCDYHAAVGVFETQALCQDGAAMIAGMSERRLVNSFETAYQRYTGEEIHLAYGTYEFGYAFKCTQEGETEPWVMQGSQQAMRGFAIAH